MGGLSLQSRLTSEQPHWRPQHCGFCVFLKIYLPSLLHSFTRHDPTPVNDGLGILPRQVAVAEVLGVVASGIAVAPLADQIATRIRNIHAFWKSIRGAPQELNDALEELEILGDTLWSCILI
jgi:hypothetical protein